MNLLYHTLAFDFSRIGGLQSALLIAGAVFLGLFFLSRARQRSARAQADAQLTAQERVKRMLPRPDIHSQITELMAKLADLSREINGQLDTRIAHLELLLHEADQTLARLEQHLAAAAAAAKDLPTSTPASKEPQPTTPAQTSDPAALIRQLRTQLAEPSPQRHPAVPQTPPSHKNPTHTNQNQKQTILDLAHQGHTPLDIARKLNRPVGEIELTLSLANQNPSQPPQNH